MFWGDFRLQKGGGVPILQTLWWHFLVLSDHFWGVNPDFVLFSSFKKSFCDTRKTPTKAIEWDWSPAPPRTENVHSFATFFILMASLMIMSMKIWWLSVGVGVLSASKSIATRPWMGGSTMTYWWTMYFLNSRISMVVFWTLSFGSKMEPPAQWFNRCQNLRIIRTW